MRLISIILLIVSLQALGREAGQMEITTDGGIEVFNEEKYYLLKKNVIILSDEFELSAELVKAFFDKDLYDIIKINSQGHVILKSTNDIFAEGEKIDIDVRSEDITILGINSLLINNNFKMTSNERINVNNKTGKFIINGPNSTLKNNDIDIVGSLIKGVFSKLGNKNDIENLYVEDNKLINIKTSTLDMYALKATYNKKNDMIELFDNVNILRDNESITGDYAKININNESYKVTSNKSEKVKVLLNNTDE